MKQWTIKAGLVDRDISNQCKIVYEPDCASLSILHHIIQNNKPPIYSDNEQEDDYKQTQNGDEITAMDSGEKYILVDAGGGIMIISI